MIFLLDTNIIIYLSRRDAEHHKQIKAKMLSMALQTNVRICVSIVSLYELEYGAVHADNDKMASESKRIIESLKKEPEITIFSLTEAGARIFGEIKELYRKEKALTKRLFKNIMLI